MLRHLQKGAVHGCLHAAACKQPAGLQRRRMELLTCELADVALGRQVWHVARICSRGCSAAHEWQLMPPGSSCRGGKLQAGNAAGRQLREPRCLCFPHKGPGRMQGRKLRTERNIHTAQFCGSIANTRLTTVTTINSQGARYRKKGRSSSWDTSRNSNAFLVSTSAVAAGSTPQRRLQQPCCQSRDWQQWAGAQAQRARR